MIPTGGTVGALADAAGLGMVLKQLSGIGEVSSSRYRAIPGIGFFPCRKYKVM